ncbi:MAG: hypothetical protein EBT22_10425 [Chloroflexi bacterium]|nr:hypothetical protein [Chloroflexota bacterium]
MRHTQDGQRSIGLASEGQNEGVVMSVQDLLAVEITPARMQLAKEPRLALGPPGVGFDRSDRTVSEYGPSALFEDLAEAVGIDPDAFARELATRQTIDTIGARYGKSPIQMRCAVMDRLRIRLNGTVQVSKSLTDQRVV